MDEESTVIGLFKGTVLENGYGYAPREIMRDEKISRSAKALYAYLMSFAGDKFSAFPKVKTVCKELGFKSKDTYYKYLYELKDLGLVYTELVKNKGKFDKNIFYITLQKTEVTKLKEQIAIEKQQSKPFPKKQETVKKAGTKMYPFPNFPYTENSYTEKQDTNINNPSNINNINKEEDTINQVFNKYLESKGKISDADKKLLRELYSMYSAPFVMKAIEIMNEHARLPSISYLKSTLKDWQSKGLNTAEKVDLYIKEHEETNRKIKEAKRKIITEPKKNTKGSFNNYQQRTYDFESIEKAAEEKLNRDFEE